MRCEFETIDDHYTCTRCGWSIATARIKVLPLNRSCDRQGVAGIGDILARVFGWIGFRKRSGCGCGKRQATLNRWIPFDMAVWKSRIRWLFWIFK